MKKLFMVLLLCVSMFGFCGQEARAQDDVKLSNDASDFVLLTDVVPDAILEIRYFSTYPQMAVSHFVRWAKDVKDTRMKSYFYPELTKDVLFPRGYIMEHSGHSRGSTVDLTLFDMTTEKEADMGGTFDYFGQLSHPDYKKITKKQYQNRMILREAMLAHGFKPLAEEWWHFTLKDEPYPDTYFTFPVSEASVKRETKAAQELKPAA